jgi:hypothetical protein
MEKQAASHTIIYQGLVELKSDGFAYDRQVQVTGPFGQKITNYLAGRVIKSSPQQSPFSVAQQWYVFEEVSTEVVTLHIIDLASGNVALFPQPQIEFLSWRPFTTELIFRDASRLGIPSWFAFDVQTGQSRCLFVGGNLAQVLTDGAYMLIVDEQEFFVALLQLDIGKLIDRKLQAEFAAYITPLLDLHFFVDQDLESSSYIGLNSRVDSAELPYEKLFRLEVK